MHLTSITLSAARSLRMETFSYVRADDHSSDAATFGVAVCVCADLPIGAWSLRYIGGGYVADQDSKSYTRKRRVPH
jgi:hypothetical protein